MPNLHLAQRQISAGANTASTGTGATGTATAGAESVPAPRAKPRDPYFDNVKYAAIVLVVVGHFWNRGEGRIMDAAYLLLYAFHMPVFIMISGYFSRNFRTTEGRIGRLVATVLVPYLIFEMAYSLFDRAVGDPAHPQRLTPTDPYWIMWFLLALFIWRLTTPIWLSLRRPVPVALGLAVAATVMHGIGGDFQLRRVLQFLPFFVLGLVLKPEHFALIRRRSTRVLAVPVSLAAAVIAYWAVPRMSIAWLYHQDSATALGVSAPVGAVMTVALFVCSLALSICFLALVPGRKLPVSDLGARTISAYLLHGFVIKAVELTDWYHAPWRHTPAGQIGVTVGAVAVATLLCSSPVHKAVRFLVEPKLRWLFKDQKSQLSTPAPRM